MLIVGGECSAIRSKSTSCSGRGPARTNRRGRSAGHGLVNAGVAFDTIRAFPRRQVVDLHDSQPDVSVVTPVLESMDGHAGRRDIRSDLR